MRYFISWFLIFALIGCASAQIASYRHPNALKSKKVTVLYPSNDLQMRRYVEGAVNDCIGEQTGLVTIDSEDIFPPTGYDPNLIVTSLVKQKVDLLVYVVSAGMNTTAYQMPSTIMWNNVGATVIPGGTINSYSASATVNAFDVRQKKVTWTANVSGGGDGTGLVIKAMTQKVCEQLVSDGLLAGRH